MVDPELGINIVDLGLVYEIDISPNGLVHIDYTLTTMGCPIGPLIEQQMQAALAHLGVTEIEAGDGPSAAVEPRDDVRGSQGGARLLLSVGRTG